MDSRERWDDPEEALRVALDGLRSGLWTAMPGIIQSFSAGAITATVQLAIKGIVHAPDGTAQFVNMPLLVDVPVHFPRGGGCTLTFPVAKGDECLVVFAARCIDGWWQSGGVQAPMDPRIHDLSDGFAFVGFFSQATKIGGISTASTQLRSNDGATYIDLNPSTKKVKIVAPGGFDVIAPLSTFSAGVTISGLLTFVGGMVGSAASGAAAVFNGILNVIGQITANGKRVDDTHTHNGVQPGSGNSGTVN
ncbi:Gp138 family membrane-puncturing spike protein [Ralstonia mannitolilytica]|uniref:Gp138 family membrane-puncturing spike protein n=1 Tax=Ralstonia mannitolilytica TaxID=105219 RepID=UPI0026F007F7|nr:Gp138 family membrane-puncturing spike protein [Ralstonia mannitolilytica]